MILISEISIVTVTFDSEEIINNFLLQDEIRAFDSKKIFIVDNASKDQTLDHIIKVNNKVNIIKNKINFGYGKAVNLAIQNIATDYCLIINPDTILKEGFFESLLLGINRNHEFGLIAPRLLSMDISLKPKKWEKDKVANFISGACFLIKPSLFHDKKIFDENIFLFYEDNDLSNRIQILGLKLIILSNCFVFHEGENSTSKNNHTDKLRNWHMGWSEAYYLFKKNNSKLIIYLSIFKKIKRMFFFLIFLRSYRFFNVFYRLRGIFSYLKGKSAHDLKDYGPF